MKEREVELNKLKDEIGSLRKDTGEATEEKKTWATKYEALERNFKQVRLRASETDLGHRWIFTLCSHFVINGSGGGAFSHRR